MEKQIKRCMAAILAAALLAGCGGASANYAGQESSAAESRQGQSADGEAAQGQSEKTYDDSLLDEYVCKEGEWKDESGTAHAYSFRIPRIADAREEAEAINREIADSFESLCRESLQAISEKNFPPAWEISWRSFWNGSILCLRLEAVTDMENNLYGVYAYDFESGKRVSREELINLAGMTPGSFAAEARTALVKAFDEDYTEAPVTGDWYGKFYYGEILPCRAQTLAEENIGDPLKLYLDAEGKLAAIATFVTPAGSGKTYKEIRIGAQEKEKVSKEVTYKGITVQIDKGKPYVTIEEPEEDYYYDMRGIRTGERLPLQGLYEDYQDIFVGNIGQSASPYLILETESGNYEYVDLIRAAKADFTCGSVPMPGLHRAESFSEGVNGDAAGYYTTIFAKTAYEDEVDLSEWLVSAWRNLPSRFTDYTWMPAGAREGEYGRSADFRMQFNEDAGFTYGKMEGAAMDMGQLTLIGVTGEGLYYAYRLFEKETGKSLEGVICFYPDRNSYDRMTAKLISGDDLFDAGEGEVLELAGLRAVGMERRGFRR